jgi:type I restriction enzyme S subunit
MNAQDLKNSILQLAIQGKLVEQREEEGTAEELIANLLDTKKELLKENKIYKKKPTEPFYYSEELPFDIPESWRWVQLSDISIIQEGAGIRKYQYRDSGIQLFSVTNILDGSIDLEKKQLYVSEEEFKEKYTHLQLNKGDIVTACSGGSWGKVAVYDNEATVMLNTSTLRLRFFEDLGNNDFLYHIVQSAFFKRQLQEQLVGIQPNFGYAHYSRICLPIPPLEEQKRIVAKIEELMPYVDKYDVAYSEMEELNKKFPEDMQKSILQYAIQGKLVEQRKEDGTAKELLEKIEAEKKQLIKEKVIKRQKNLPEVTEEEIDFEIPQSWEWTRLEAITYSIGNKSNQIKQSEMLQEGRYPVVSQSMNTT